VAEVVAAAQEDRSVTLALVTGANGFLGSAVVRALLAEGVAVRALVRPGSDRRNLADLDAEIVAGDLTDRGSLEKAVADCVVVFHVAANYRLWVADPEPMYRANVDGSVSVLEATAAAGAARMVYTSSVAVLGVNKDRTPADERTPVSVGEMVGHYKRSKFLAEAAVRKRAEELGFPVVTVNPSTPIGPRDIKPTPTGRILLDAAAGRMPAYVDTGLNLVHVDDVAQGQLAAWRKGRPGERYVLGGEDFTLKQILELVARHVGRRASTIRLPHWSVYPLAVGAEALARVTKREPRVTLDGVRMSTKHMYFSSRKAQRELDYRWRDPRMGLTEAVDWFKANGYF
jgi:dihydroflavonol-4-reductase